MSSPHLEGERLEVAVPSDAEQAHLAGCEACRLKRRDAAARRRLLAGLTPYTLSDVAFRRVEARLMEQVEAGLPSRWPASRWLAWLTPAAAGVGALAWLLLAPGPATEAAEAPAVAQRVVRAEPLTVVRASGGAQVRRGAAWEPLRAGEVVAVGQSVQGALLLAPASGPAWSFELDGEATLGGAATLVLARGELRARVAGAEASIASAGLQVLATEALFLVQAAAAEVLVEVAEGQVELREASAARRTLTAPVRVRWAPGAAELVPLALEGVAVGALPARPWVRFDATALPAGARLTLDGLDLGVAPVDQLVSAGKHRLSVALAGQPAHESWLELAGDYRVEPPPLPEPEQEAPPLDRAAVARVQAELQRQVPRLAACYEKWLKQNPHAAGDVELHLVVTPRGRVKRADVVGRALSVASADCVERLARGLQLPPLGSEVELQLPLRLTTSP